MTVISEKFFARAPYFATSPAASARAQRCDGFTLIEMLVVILIAGLMIGLTSIMVQPTGRDLLQLEAERLARLLDLAATESRLSGKYIEWTSDGREYRFWRKRPDYGWTEILDNDLYRRRMLPRGVLVTSLRIESIPRQDPMRLEFAPYGQALAFTIELASGTDHYLVLSSPMGDVRAAPLEGYPGGTTAIR